MQELIQIEMKKEMRKLLKMKNAPSGRLLGMAQLKDKKLSQKVDPNAKKAPTVSKVAVR